MADPVTKRDFVDVENLIDLLRGQTLDPLSSDRVFASNNYVDGWNDHIRSTIRMLQSRMLK